MERHVIKIADHIISPLGSGTEENYQAVKAGKSGLALHEGTFGLPEKFFASLFDREYIAALPSLDGMSDFEKVVYASASAALSAAGINPSSENLLYILSSTKGNIAAADQGETDQEMLSLARSARVLKEAFHSAHEPIVVSNACISGVCALLEATRALKSGRYDHAVVVGCDLQSKFIISGFQSFKALSSELCRPFDRDRKGLNLGEAAAAIVLKAVDEVQSGQWEIMDGCVRNDANHISGPSRTGEGSYRALKYVLATADQDELAFINVHGTATPYNDEMESIALHRAGLDTFPVNALKGYFGHTLGAAGVLESILSMKAVDDHTVLATKGFQHTGVTYPAGVSSENRSTSKHAFIKLLSGFGGCNAAMLFQKKS